MPAKKKFPVAHVFAESAQFNCAYRFHRFKSRDNIMRRMFAPVPNEQCTAPNKKIYAFLLGEYFFRGFVVFRWLIDKLIVARPERELVYQILRLDQITRRMSRTLDTLVLQIKRNLRRAMALVRNHKQLLAEFGLKITAYFLNFGDHRFPAAKPIARVAAPE